LQREADLRERERLAAMLTIESEARQQGYRLIAGVDEAGRGPLAGPVVAAAVVLPESPCFPGLNDSKLVSAGRRETLYEEIACRALAWSIGIGTVSEIDEMNVLQATRLAMLRAITSLTVKPDLCLIDALRLDGLDCSQQAIVGGDRLSLTIAAASILAKVTRDRLMLEMDKVYPGYGFARHKGYPTKEHYRNLAEMGCCPLHRKSFLPAAEASQT
jgi:ribonuclease HII